MRIMLWNIQDLSVNKFLPSVADPTQLRQQHVTNNIAEVNPDILVVLEVETAGADGPGSLVSATSGGPAVLGLLYHLRSVDPGGQWGLVPPLILGNTATGFKEAIAVYFRNTVVDFAGPFQLGRPVFHPTGYAGQSLGGAALTYPDPWSGALPAIAPVGAPVGTNLNQNQLTGRWQWPRNFPQAQHRPPLQTIFREKVGANRTINLFSMHSPSNATHAAQALAQLAQLAEISSPLVGNEVRVVAADFNVNRLNPNHQNDYDPMTNLGYQLLFQNIAAHQTTVARASTRGLYPYFGYMSQGPPTGVFPLPDPGYNRKLLCNFLISPGGRTGYVVNRVVGTIMPHANIPVAMNESIAILGLTDFVDQAAEDLAFVNIDNFGKIRGASDHMAMFVDI